MQRVRTRLERRRNGKDGFLGVPVRMKGGEFGWMEGREIVRRRSTKFETNFADRRVKTI